jgi:hypothetical protein
LVELRGSGVLRVKNAWSKYIVEEEQQAELRAGNFKVGYIMRPLPSSVTPTANRAAFQGQFKTYQ